jgi:prepilin-type N-terminal cleavage/methylation domain-containing protein
MNMFSRKNKKGFTLIELIVVIAILAILAAIAIPSFIGITQNANDTVKLANARTIATAINANNTLYYKDATKQITSTPADGAALKTALGDMYPNQLSESDATVALSLITITGGVATIPTQDAVAAPAST